MDVPVVNKNFSLETSSFTPGILRYSSKFEDPCFLTFTNRHLVKNICHYTNARDNFLLMAVSRPLRQMISQCEEIWKSAILRLLFGFSPAPSVIRKQLSSHKVLPKETYCVVYELLRSNILRAVDPSYATIPFQGEVESIAFNPEGDVFVINTDAGVQVYKQGKNLEWYWSHNFHSLDHVRAAHSTGETVVTAQKESCDLSVWKMKQMSIGKAWEKISTLKGCSSPVLKVSFAPNGMFFMTAEKDGILRIWERSKEENGTLKLDESWELVESVAVTSFKAFKASIEPTCEGAKVCFYGKSSCEKVFLTKLKSGWKKLDAGKSIDSFLAMDCNSSFTVFKTFEAFTVVDSLSKDRTILPDVGFGTVRVKPSGAGFITASAEGIIFWRHLGGGWDPECQWKKIEGCSFEEIGNSMLAVSSAGGHLAWVDNGKAWVHTFRSPEMVVQRLETWEERRDFPHAERTRLKRKTLTEGGLLGTFEKEHAELIRKAKAGNLQAAAELAYKYEAGKNREQAIFYYKIASRVGSPFRLVSLQSLVHLYFQTGKIAEAKASIKEFLPLKKEDLSIRLKSIRCNVLSVAFNHGESEPMTLGYKSQVRALCLRLQEKGHLALTLDEIGSLTIPPPADGFCAGAVFGFFSSFFLCKTGDFIENLTNVALKHSESFGIKAAIFQAVYEFLGKHLFQKVVSSEFRQLLATRYLYEVKGYSVKDDVIGGLEMDKARLEAWIQETDGCFLVGCTSSSSTSTDHVVALFKDKGRYLLWDPNQGLINFPPENPVESIVNYFRLIYPLSENHSLSIHRVEPLKVS